MNTRAKRGGTREQFPLPLRPEAVAAYAAFTLWCVSAAVDPTASTPDDVETYLAQQAMLQRNTRTRVTGAHA